MINSPADILRYCMINMGACTLPTDEEDWPGYVNVLPESNRDNLVLFTDTTGISDGRHMRTGQTIEHPGTQILVRSDRQTDAWKTCNYISNAMDAVYRQWVIIDSNAYLLLAITRRTSITPLNTEQHFKALEHLEKEIKLGRFMFAINVTMTIENQINPITLPPSLTYPGKTGFWHIQTPAGSIDGSNKIFTVVALPLSTENYNVFLDGVRQTAFTLVGTTLTFTTAPTVGQVLLLISIDEG